MSDGPEILSDEKRVRSDARMIETATRNRWPITPEMKEMVINRLANIVARSESEERASTAARTMMMAEGQNQADDHVREKNERIDSGKATDASTVRVLKVEFDK